MPLKTDINRMVWYKQIFSQRNGYESASRDPASFRRSLSSENHHIIFSVGYAVINFRFRKPSTSATFMHVGQSRENTIVVLVVFVAYKD